MRVGPLEDSPLEGAAPAFAGHHTAALAVGKPIGKTTAVAVAIQRWAAEPFLNNQSDSFQLRVSRKKVSRLEKL